MTKKRDTFSPVAVVLALLAGMTMSPIHAEENARVTLGATAVDFVLPAGVEAATLSLSGPGELVLKRAFGNQSAFSFELFEQGQRLPDGQYNWELVAAPRLSAATREEVSRARAAGNNDLALERLGGAKGLVQSGSFRIEGGVVITDSDVQESPIASKAQSPIAARDQVFADDVIVNGSICVGVDCINNENFGADTLRLKENNLRIHFDDTSSSGGFPNNDWRLTANDQANGGANYFSIDDVTGGKVPFKVEAGTATNTLYVDSSGNIGIGTSTPVLDLHVATGDSPGLRLEQNGSSGFTAQTWDVAGNEANFFVRDLTNASKLPFRIRPGAPTSSIDIAASGDVGVGTQSPSAPIDIVRSADAAEVQATTFSDDGTLFSNMLLRRALGTSSAPAAVTTNSIIGSFSFRGHDGANFSSENVARLEVRADGDFSSTSQPTRILLQTTAVGSTSPNTRLVVKNDGSVGIGTNNPTAGSRLEVSGGDIRVTGGSFIDDGTTLAVPDYVFEPDYSLMSLDQLEGFLAEHKHLPNVPSEKEIKGGGLNLSKFQMRLLEKVEELTLYTLEQHRNNRELKAENATLIARLEAIEAALASRN